MSKQPSGRYSIGSDRKCDVVVIHSGVANFHCELTFDHDRWALTPKDGEVGVRIAGDDRIRWSSDPIQVEASDNLWLTQQTRLPWPSDTGAVRVLTVGRAIDCDITLNYPAISGRHARLIIGQRRTLVLADCASQNGLFVDDSLVARISATMLQPGQLVFFGSIPISTDELMVMANSSPTLPVPPAHTESPPRESGSSDARTSKLDVPAPWVGKVFTIGVPAIGIVLASLFWVIRSQAPAEPVTDLPAPTASLRAQEPDSDESLAPSVVTGVGGSSTGGKRTVDSASTDPNPTSPASIRNAVYWILLRHDATDIRYRLGAGTAIASDQLLTTGSIVRTINEMVDNGYSMPSVVSVNGGTVLPIESLQAWREFSKRTDRAVTLRSAHAQMVEDLSGDRPTDAEARSIRELNFALSAASAADIGWMRVENMDHHVEVDASVVFRPGLAVELLDVGFDDKDPFYDLEDERVGSSRDDETVRLRATAQGPSIGSITGAIQLDCPKSNSADRNLIGSPLVRGGSIVGIIVFQSDEVGESTMQVEAVSASTIGAAMLSVNQDFTPSEAPES